jgi:putative addiction module antidote
MDRSRVDSGGPLARRSTNVILKTMSALKVTSIGNSLGIIIPKEIAVRLRLERGDELHVVETPRGIELTPYDPALEEELKAGRSVMKRYRSTLRKLAK